VILLIKIKLSELLGKNKMTRKALAELVDVRPNTIGDLYHEKVKRIDLDLLNNICNVLDCELSDLIEYQRDEER
jgi:putative transcriptional regulator